MPRLDSELKEQIRNLDFNILNEIVLKLIAKEQWAYDFVLLNYLDKDAGEKDLFTKTKIDLDLIFRKRHKGFSEELQVANMLKECIKRVNMFTKISKNKVLEADLLLYILKVPFSLSVNMFGTCFTQYDTKVAIIVKRLLNLVTNKLHDDYKAEYIPLINEYLEVLHRTSNHIDTVYGLPIKIS